MPRARPGRAAMPAPGTRGGRSCAQDSIAGRMELVGLDGPPTRPCCLVVRSGAQCEYRQVILGQGAARLAQRRLANRFREPLERLVAHGVEHLAELLVTERLCRGLPGQHHAVAHRHDRIPREQARQLLLVTRLDGGADRGAALAETPAPAAIAGDEEERRDAGVAGAEPARGRELPDPERYRWPDPEAW